MSHTRPYSELFRQNLLAQRFAQYRRALSHNLGFNEWSISNVEEDVMKNLIKKSVVVLNQKEMERIAGGGGGDLPGHTFPPDRTSN